MNFLAIGISLAIIVASVLFAPKEEPVIEKQQEVLSATQEPSPTAVTPEEIFMPAPATPTPTSTPDFQYPGSRTDDVDKITDWYKEKIKASGYNVTSFVTTKTNGKVLNKLVAAKSDGRIEVVITKDPGEPTTQITVELDNAQ